MTIVTTENDAMNGAAMLFGKLLTGTSQIFSDVRTYWSPEAARMDARVVLRCGIVLRFRIGMDAAVTGWKPDGIAAGGFIHLINSGATTMDGTGKQKIKGKPAMKPYWEITAKEAGACLDATSWRPADLGYFRGGGYSSDFLTEGGMPVTMTRLNLVKGIGPVLQIAEGVTAALPDHVHDKLDKRTSETARPVDASPPPGSSRALPAQAPSRTSTRSWPTEAPTTARSATACMPRPRRRGLHHPGQHARFVKRRIPVCMHNVDAEQIQRPSYWNAFGMDAEGSDYRACQALGPLYGKK